MNPSGDFTEDANDLLDAEIWEEVYCEQYFDFIWPSLTDNEGVIISSQVISVIADEWPDVEYDLIGVRGAYRWCALFKPEIYFATHQRFSPQAFTYLYYYAPDPNPYKIVPYQCQYINGAWQTNKIRVWQDYTIGKNWIVTRIAAENARDTEPSLPSTLSDDPCPQPPD